MATAAKKALSIAPLPDEGGSEGAGNGEAPKAAKKAYTFETLVFEELPQVDGAGGSRPTPWKAKFDEISAQVLADNKVRAFYVPLSYYVDERGVDPEKATHAYVKQKITDDWNKWLKADASRPTQFELAKGNRLGTEDGYTELGAGVLVIIKRLKG